MANKALAKRQKLSYRVEPSQKALKPRNLIAVAAKKRAAGSHQKSVSSLRQTQKQALRKLLEKSKDGSEK